jgi:hypothetical protein
VANALPQALVLTAIVIGFGLFAFALTLVYRTYQNLGTLNSDEMRLAEPEGTRANELDSRRPHHHSLRHGGAGLPVPRGPEGRWLSVVGSGRC